MDFATEEKLCRLAHEVWRQVAAEPDGTAGAADQSRAAEADLGGSLHLADVFTLEGRETFG